MKFKLNYVVIPLLVLAVSGAGGALTTLGRTVDTWYQTLTLPAWAPGSTVISSAWTIIFILSAISLLIAWNKTRGQLRIKIALLFFINAAVNVLWSWLFFVQHELLLAFFDALLILLTVLALIYLLRRAGKEAGDRSLRWAAIALFPYAGWVTLASYLTYMIYVLN